MPDTKPASSPTSPAADASARPAPVREHPSVKTFPGPVRFVGKAPEGAPTLRIKTLTNDKGVFTGSEITVPPGWDLTWKEKPGQGTEPPTFLARVVKEQLAHAPETPEDERHVPDEEEDEDAPAPAAAAPSPAASSAPVPAAPPAPEGEPEIVERHS